MTNLRVALGFILILLLAGCGNPVNNTVNGTWNATLTDSGGATMTFTASISTAADGTVSASITNFTGDTYGCLSNPQTPYALAIPGTDSNGQKTTFLDLSMGSPTSNGNDGISLSGPLSSGKISGNWNMTGPAIQCNDHGTFTMVGVPAPYLPKGS